MTIDTTPVVAVGVPPTLPAAGADSVGLVGVGSGLVLLGLVFVALRWVRRPMVRAT